MSQDRSISVTTYVIIWATLIAMTFLTWSVSYIDMGPFNILVALVIATFKMSLVIYFFMHVKFDDKLTRLFVVAGFVWLMILIVLTLSDYFTRDWKPAQSLWHQTTTQP
ncbi:MAG TPA: cytochrome C oxidase subunit IV family protein [Bryobacteraceae bacterium]|nr:cytochrome C oxidase subunit IV family protein [Bryobacteraceae bacterium]